jgi:hypothetical protein
MSDGERRYTQEEVKAILQRALSRGGGERSEQLSHTDLVETAKEVGIEPATLERAIAEEAIARDEQALRAEWMGRRRSAIRGMVLSWAMVNAICLAVNLLAGGPFWFLWVLVPWGIVVAFSALALHGEPSPEQIAAVARRRERRRLREERRERRRLRRAQIRRGAEAIEEVVEEGVSLLLEQLGEGRRQLGPGARRRPDEPRDK